VASNRSTIFSVFPCLHSSARFILDNYTRNITFGEECHIGTKIKLEIQIELRCIQFNRSTMTSNFTLIKASIYGS